MRCRKKFHPIAERFYYEIVEGWAKGFGFWTKPSPLKHLAPPRNDIPTRTPDLRRLQVCARPPPTPCTPLLAAPCTLGRVCACAVAGRR